MFVAVIKQQGILTGGIFQHFGHNRDIYFSACYLACHIWRLCVDDDDRTYYYTPLAHVWWVTYVWGSNIMNTTHSCAHGRNGFQYELLHQWSTNVQNPWLSWCQSHQKHELATDKKNMHCTVSIVLFITSAQRAFAKLKHFWCKPVQIHGVFASSESPCCILCKDTLELLAS